MTLGLRTPYWTFWAALCLLLCGWIQPAQAALVCSTATPITGAMSGVVNDYWVGSGSPTAGSGSITLGARRAGGAGAAISPGDLVLLIQMQDADINSTNSNAYGSGGTSGAGSTAVNRSGAYEYVVATSSVSAAGGTLSFTPALTNSYRSRSYTAGSNGQSTWQAIRIPSYASASASNVTAPVWNGSSGGVVALDVEGLLTLSGTTAINVAGLGFRGGAGRGLGGSASGANTDYRTLATNNANGSKGEGIAGRARYLNNAAGYNTAPLLEDTATEGYPNGSNARGAPGNAGGGGTDGETSSNQMNSGGGGGSNYGSGGRGGNTWNNNLAVGGIGGASYSGALAFNRVFMGGGGGAGTTNNSTSDTATYSAPPGLACSSGALCSSGAAGGGIVIVRAGSVSGGGLIDARGADAYNVANDGAGGGGAGGSVVLQTYSGGSASVNVSGGNGGNAWRSTTAAADRHGPGGGGGGGFIAYSPSIGLALTASYASGLNGRTSNNDAYGTTSSTGGLSAFDTPNVPGAQGGAFCPPAIKAVRLFTDGGIPGQVNPGDTVEYTVIYRNGSSNSIAGFNIADPLPAGLNYVPSSLAIATSGGASASANAGYNGTSTSSLLSSATTLPSGGIIQATFRASVSGGATCGTNILNQADSVQTSGENIDLTDSADNDQNSSGLPVATYISQTPFGTTGATNPTGINVVCPTVTIGKSFSPAAVNMSGASTLTITLTNFTASALTGAAFIDTYPAGILNAASPAPTNTCGGTATAAAGVNSIALSGGSIPANGSCVLSVSVIGTATATNTIPVGGLTVNGGASNTVAASATLTVAQPPVLSKNFSPSLIAIGGSSTLTITLSNPNAGIAATGAALTDTYPAGVVNAATPAVATTCGGTATAAAGGNTVALSGGSIPAGGSCTVTVNVTSSAAGSHVNTIPIGGVSTSNIGSSQVAATGTLTVLLPPTVEKSFSPASVDESDNAPENQSVMTITLSNPNGVALTGAAFDDDYPQRTTGGGEYLRNLNANFSEVGEGNSCGGTATATTGNGTSSLVLSGGTIPANGSCSVSIRVYADGSGSYVNTIAVGGVTTAQGIANTVAASATFSANRLGITKNFNATSIGTGGTSTLTLVLSNPTDTSRTAVGVVDNYPAGIVNATPPNASTVCSSGTNGTVTATAGGASLTLAGATLTSGGGICTVTVTVTSATAGVYTNITNPITASGDGGATASDVLTVLARPTVAKTFSPSTISAGGTATLTITLSNSNTSANITGVAFTDTYPANLVNAGSPSAATTCGGNVSAAAGGGTVALSGGSIPAGSSCTVTVDVTSANGGSYTNTLAAGSVSSTNAGSNTSGTSDVLTVIAYPSLVFLKTVALHSDPVNGTSAPKNIPGAEVDYTLSVTNTGPGSVDSSPPLTLVDPIPPNTELFVGDLGGGLPFVFVNSSSGLSCGAGCMDVSSDGGTSWIPVPGGPYAPAVTHLRFRPSGSMSGDASAGPPSPSFSLQFRVRIK